MGNSSRFVMAIVVASLLAGPASADNEIKKSPARTPDVHFVPTPHEVVEIMLRLADVKRDDIVYDLGCGDGRILIAAARKAGCRAIGFDIDPEMVERSQENVREAGLEHLITVKEADIFSLDLSEATVITLYLLPSLNVRLIPQLEKLGPGARIVSHDFDMAGVQPEVEAEVTFGGDGVYQTRKVYLWTTPLTKTEDLKPQYDEYHVQPVFNTEQYENEEQ